MLAKAMTAGTFVICGDCGSTIYPWDLESQVEAREDKIWLRCRNNCCGHVGCYAAADLITNAQSNTIDYTTRIFLEG